MFSDFYYEHLERWLKSFTPNQLLIIDADKFMLETHEYLIKLQQFFQLESLIDYSQSLFRNEESILCLKKEYFEECFDKIENTNYNNIDKESYTTLKQFFIAPNKILAKLLNEHGYEIPFWLY